MKSTVRSTIAAAALLLVPMTAALVATPAAAQSGPHNLVPSQVLSRVELLDVPRPRSEVRYRAYGMAGGFAMLEVPGVTRVKMNETQPGVYEATAPVRPSDDLRTYSNAVVTMMQAGERVTARVGGVGADPIYTDNGAPGIGRGPVFAPPVFVPGNRYSQPAPRDNRAPRISDLTPDNGSWVEDRGRTRISARFSDDLSGVDPASVSLRVDGRDVTRNARVDDNGVRYADDLRPGRHVAEVIVRDRAGNTARQAWSFGVEDNGYGGYGGDGGWNNGYGYGYGYGDRGYRW